MLIAKFVFGNLQCSLLRLLKQLKNPPVKSVDLSPSFYPNNGSPTRKPTL